MKLISSITLSFIFMLQAIMPNVDIGCEFQKITEIYDHYQEHKAFDGDSFLDFVLEDYINNDGSLPEHKTNSNHQESPYHNAHQSCCSLFYFPTNQEPTLVVFDTTENMQYNHYKAFFSSAYLESLFQPPRV